MTTKKFKPPTDTFRRVYRGGSWIDTSATFVRAACRFVPSPSNRIDDIGFRTVQSGCRRKGVTPP